VRQQKGIFKPKKTKKGSKAGKRKEKREIDIKNFVLLLSSPTPHVR